MRPSNTSRTDLATTMRQSTPASMIRLGRADTGSASLEFITAGVLLLVPVVYLVIALGALQGAAFAAEGAAHAAVRAQVRAVDASSARASIDGIVRLAAADFGLDPEAATAQVACAPATRDCLGRGSLVTVSVTVEAPLPLVPAFLDTALPLRIPMSASATQRVSVLGPAVP